MRKERPERRPRKGIARGIYIETDAQGRTRYGLSYAAHFDDGTVKNKRELLDPSVRTLPAARKALRAALADTERGRLVYKAQTAPTFNAFAADYVAARALGIPASISRVRVTVAAATKVFGGVAIDKVTPLDVERFKTRRLTTCAPGTVKRDLAVLHALFVAAVRVYKVRGDNPCEHVHVDKYQETPRRVLTLEDERRLLDAAAPHLRAFILVAINTGLRLSELTGLEWRDVDFVQNHVTLRATKSRTVQSVPLNRTARETLLALYGAGRIGRVFTFEGQALENPKKGLAGAARRAGIGKVTCHMFRHTCATRLLQAGVDIRTVQAWLRHADITTTARYLRSADLSEAGEKLAAFGESRPALAPRVSADLPKHS